MAKFKVIRNQGYPAVPYAPHAFGDVIEGTGPEMDAAVNAGYLEPVSDQHLVTHPAPVPAAAGAVTPPAAAGAVTPK
jgi:hypothetical protein